MTSKEYETIYGSIQPKRKPKTEDEAGKAQKDRKKVKKSRKR